MLQNGCAPNNVLYGESGMKSDMMLTPRCVMPVAKVTVAEHPALKRPEALQLE